MSHVPVLLQEVIEYLKPQLGEKYIDATIGGGGHTRALVEQGGIVLGIDRDREAVKRLGAEFKTQSEKCKIIHGSFADLRKIAADLGFREVSGIVFDLGMSSNQLDDGKRGFAFQKDGPLDMRFSQDETGTAGELLNFLPEKELVAIFGKYGEEYRFGKKIARAVALLRKTKNLETTTELFEIIKKALPAQFRFRSGDVARKIFQSLRIAVNDELGSLERALPQAGELLKTGGRLAVISFHSLEDRIVKNFFIQSAKDCICPPSFPVCRCNHKPILKILTKKPITASSEETKTNPRAHSAKLRVAEKI